MTDPVKIDIAQITPDYVGIRDALFSILGKRSAWTGDLTTQTGTTLIDMIATVATHAQVKLLRYAQDAYPETALSLRALYALAAKSGAPIRRKTAASATVSVTSLVSDVGVAAYTQFTGAGFWFNRDAVFIPANPTNDPAKYVTFEVYQGELRTVNTVGGSGDFQVFRPAEQDFLISNDDIVVKANGNDVPVVDDSLYNYKNQKVIQDVTLPTGGALLVFGSGTYGFIPSPSDVLSITYAVTDGLTYNGRNIAGTPVTLASPALSRVKGTFKTNPSGGAFQTDPARYRTLAPAYFGSNQSAVTPSQYFAIASDYPGVVDVFLQSQREIDPSDFWLMNVIRIAVLTDPPNSWTIPQKQAYLKHLEQKTMFAPRFDWMPLTSYPTTVKARIYAKKTADIGSVKSDADAAIRSLFAIRQGSLGYDIAMSDITDAVLESNTGVDYVDLISPSSDINVNPQSISSPILSLTQDGILTAGVYSYGIGYDTAQGTVAPLFWGNVINPFQTVTVGETIQGGASITVAWDKPSNPPLTAYYVYGRSGTTKYGLLATIPVASVLTRPDGTLYWKDDGTAIPGKPPLLANSFPPMYAELLGDPIIEVQYSTRRNRL